MRADEDIHGVELQHADAVDDAAEVGGGDAAGGARLSKVLGGEGDAACGRVGEASRGQCEARIAGAQESPERQVALRAFAAITL